MALRARTARPPQRRRAPRTPPLSSSIRDCAAARRGGMALLVGAVARADEWAGEDRAEAERLSLLAEPPEFVGVHPAVDGRVLRARLEVLPDRDDVDAVLAQVAHRLHHLVVALAEADDDPALRQHGVVRELLRAQEQ